jgi:hypothetical protein
LHHILYLFFILQFFLFSLNCSDYSEIYLSFFLSDEINFHLFLHSYLYMLERLTALFSKI